MRSETNYQFKQELALNYEIQVVEVALINWWCSHRESLMQSKPSYCQIEVANGLIIEIGCLACNLERTIAIQSVSDEGRTLRVIDHTPNLP